MVKATIDFKNSERLLQAMSKIPEQSEDVINRFLKSKGTTEVMHGIVGFMPISARKKHHAKESSSLKERLFNLGFEVLPKPTYSYLVFPNDGRGAHNKVAQEFFEKGLESKEDMLLDMLVDELVRVQEKALSI